MVTMDDETKLLRFPCSYPLKVLGKNTLEFYAMVSAVISKHLAGSGDATYYTKASSGGKYLSVTATFQAQSEEQLAAIYQELSQSKLVLMTF
jgi:putative lipoic acid-binding regulatory protein